MLKLSDWYSASRKDIVNKGGGELFKYYPSLYGALKAIYPEFAWDLSRFAALGKAPHSYWQDNNNLLAALEQAEQRMGIKEVCRSFSSALWF